MINAKTQAGSYRAAISARYWNTARVVLEHHAGPSAHFEPLLYLLGMAAELSLKAFLTHAGMSDQELSGKKVGHDLRACLRQCVQRGMILTANEVKGILTLRQGHLDHFTRYGPKAHNGVLELGAMRLANPTVVLSLIASVIDRVTGDPDVLRRHGTETRIEWPETPLIIKACTLSELAALEQEEQQEVNRISALNAKLERQFGMKMMR